MSGVTYDTGVLLAAERGERTTWNRHAALVDEEVIPVVPAPVLAQAWRGGHRQARLARFLSTCQIEPMSEDQAREVGVLSGRSRHDDIVDVAVVEGAARRGDAIVTSDPGHIRQIADAVGGEITIRTV